MHQLSRFVGTVGLSAGGVVICVVGLVSVLSVGRAEAHTHGCHAVLPGDGQGGTDLDFGLDHGPALSYMDNGDGTFTDNKHQTDVGEERHGSWECP